MKRRPLSTIQSVTFFLIISLIWILSTDYLLLQAFSDNIRLYHYVQSFKGVAFVGLTATIIYLIIRRNSKYFDQKYNALVFNHTELETILAETDLSIARLNSEGQILYMNSFFCTLTGYNSAELLQQHYGLIIKAEDNVELEYWDLMLMQGKLSRMRNLAVITTREQAKLICNVTVNEVKDQTGAPVYILILENITNR